MRVHCINTPVNMGRFALCMLEGAVWAQGRAIPKSITMEPASDQGLHSL